MARRILVVPTNHGAGVTSTCLGLVQALDRLRVSVGYLKPFAQARWVGEDESVELFRLTTSQRPPAPIAVAHLEEMLALDRVGSLMEEVVDLADDALREHSVVVIEGLAPGTEQVYSGRVNAEMARSLDADVLFVANASRLDPQRLAHSVGVANSQYVLRGAPRLTPSSLTAAVADGQPKSRRKSVPTRVIGVVVNHVPPDRDPSEFAAALQQRGLHTVASIPDNPEFTRRRVGDIVRELGLEVVNVGDQSRRIHGVEIAAQAAPGYLSVFQEDRLVVVPGDRHEVLMSAALAETKGTRLAGVLLTVGIRPHDDVLDLCRPALEAGLPVLLSPGRTYETVTRVLGLDPDIPADDEARANLVKNTMAEAFDERWLLGLPSDDRLPRSTPAAFRREVVVAAARAEQRIALTDATDPATLVAAINLQARSVVRCVLVGDTAAIEAAAAEVGLDLPAGLAIAEPAAGVEPLAAGLRMLAEGTVDGLVGGADADLEEVGRRAEAAVGLRSDAEVVSSIHYLMLPDEVVAYTDCALNPHPTAEQLAAIGLWAAEESQTVGITPRIAFIEPRSSSDSVAADTERVREAVQLAAGRRPDIHIEGPVAFNAASRRASNGEGGNGTVFVFPDGAAAESTFHAVHRTSGVRAVGPILQGLNRPVNRAPGNGDALEVNEMIVATAVQASRNF